MTDRHAPRYTATDRTENTAFNSSFTAACASVATGVFADPFPSNGCLCWLHKSIFQQTCHIITSLRISAFYSFLPQRCHEYLLWPPSNQNVNTHQWHHNNLQVACTCRIIPVKCEQYNSSGRMDYAASNFTEPQVQKISTLPRDKGFISGQESLQELFMCQRILRSWSWVILRSSCFYETPMVQYCIHKRSPMDCSLIRINPVHNLTLYICVWYILILSSHPPTCLPGVFFQFSDKIAWLLCTPCVLHDPPLSSFLISAL
jgi:hypothetical protein